MKTKTTLLASIILTASLALALAGCSMFGSNPAAPSKFESSLFEVQTNFVNVPVKVSVTNQVELTNTLTVTRTNEVGVPVPVLLTNIISVPQYSLLTVTQEVAQYTLKPSTNTTANIGAVGSIVNQFAPGAGTLVGGILGGLLLAWGKLRSAKNVGTTLAQNIETIREFVKTLPDGAKYDKVIVDYLQAHQNETGAAANILSLLNNYVSNPEAKGTVQELQAALASLK